MFDDRLPLDVKLLVASFLNISWSGLACVVVGMTRVSPRQSPSCGPGNDRSSTLALKGAKSNSLVWCRALEINQKLP